MKRSTVIWIVLGVVGIIVLGFAAGYFLNGGLFGRGYAMHSAMPFARAGRGLFMPGLVGAFFGLGMLIRWVGPLAGIAALIIVLTRRPAPAPAAAAPAQPAPPAEEAATSAPSEEGTTRASRKK